MLVCGCDDSGPEFYSENYPVAKKEHRCCECGRTIEVGEEYQYFAGKWEGGFNAYKTCFDCAGLWESLRDLGYCQIFTALGDAYREYLEMEGKFYYDEDRDEYIYPNNRLTQDCCHA